MTRPSSNRSRYLINKKNQKRLYGLIDKLFNDYSKFLVISLDFYLKNDFDDRRTYYYMNEAFERLRNNRRGQNRMPQKKM